MSPPDLDINGLYIFLTFFLVLLNGFFVAAEFAIVKVRASQIEIQVKSGKRIAKIAQNITQNLDGYLAATQLGITIASLGLGWFGQDVATKLMLRMFWMFGLVIKSDLIINISHVAAFAFITILHIVFGELAPKSFVIQRPVGVTMGISVPLNIFYAIFKPVIWLLNKFANPVLSMFGIKPVEGHEAHHSSEELQYLLDQGKESGAIDSNEHELI